MHDYSGLATWFAWTTVDFQMQCSTGDDIRATSCWLAREMVQGFSESAISTRQLGIRLQEKYRGTRPVMLVMLSQFADDHISALPVTRARRKETKTSVNPITNATHVCHICGRQCALDS